MNELENRLHYRVVDVSSIKELVLRWDSSILKGMPPKLETHRALDDVIESIEEFEKAIPMMMTAAGTITPAKILIWYFWSTVFKVLVELFFTVAQYFIFPYHFIMYNEFECVDVKPCTTAVTYCWPVRPTEKTMFIFTWYRMVWELLKT